MKLTLDIAAVIVIHTLCAFVAKGQSSINRKIDGKVMDNKNRPIPYGSIKLMSNSSPMILAFTYGDSTGKFLLQNIDCKDSVRIGISAVGYDTKFTALTCDSIDGEHKFYLQATINSLPDINVRVTPSFVQKKDTTIFYADFYRKSGQQNLSDLLKNMPGFEVSDNGKILFNGKAVSKVLITNDDMFQNNYSILSNNLSSLGINTVEVIENYKDRYDMSKSLESGGEMVINLSFKKKDGELLGSISLAGGLPFSNYETKSDMISLGNRSKILGFANFNTVGNLAVNASGSRRSEIPEYSDENILPTNPSVNLSDFNSNRYLKENNFFFNRSRYLNANFRTTISNKFILKSNVSYEQDNYSQDQSSIQHFIGITPSISIAKSDYLNRDLRKVSVFSEGSMSFTKKLQIIASAQIQSRTSDAAIRSNFFSTNVLSELTGTGTGNSFKLKSTYLLGEQSLLTVQLLYQSSYEPQTLSLSPIPLDSYLNFPTNYQAIEQNLNKNKNSSVSFISFFSKKSKFGFLKFIVDLQKNRQFFLSQIAAASGSNNVLLGDSLQNNTLLNTDVRNASIMYSVNPNNKLTLSFNLKFSNNSAYLVQMATEHKNGVEKNFVLPNVSMSYNFSSASRISISFAQYVTSTPMQRNLPGYSFANNLYIYRGDSSSVDLLLKTTVNLNYSYLDLMKRRIIFVSGLLYTKNNNNTVMDLRSIQLLVVGNYVFYPNYDDLAVAFSRLEKILPLLKSRMSINVSIYNRNSISSIKSNLINNKFFGYALESDFHYNNSGKASFDAKITLSQSFQYDRNSLNENVKSHDIFVNINGGVNVAKNIFLNLNSDYVHNSSPNNNAGLILSNILVEMKPKLKNLTFSIFVRNLLDKRDFSSYSQNSFSYTVSNTALVGRYVLGRVTYNF